MKFFTGGLKDLSIGPVFVSIDEAGVYTAYLKEGGKIIFDESEDFSRLLENLRLAISGREDLEGGDFSEGGGDR